MLSFKRIICAYTCISIILAYSPFISSSLSKKSELNEKLSKVEIADKKTYAALFSSANGLLGTSVDIDRMSSFLTGLGAASVVSDKTATAEDLAKITAMQARLADQNNGNLFLYFSGHGLPYKVILEDTGFSVLRWLRYVDASVTGGIDVTIFLDTCFAGSIVEIVSKGKFKHINNVIVAASSQANATSPEYGDIFGGAFTGSFYLAYETYKIQHPYKNPNWNDVIGYLYRIYAVITPNTVPVFQELKLN